MSIHIDDSVSGMKNREYIFHYFFMINYETLSNDLKFGLAFNIISKIEQTTNGKNNNISIDNYVSCLWTHAGRNYAIGRLPIFLRL